MSKHTIKRTSQTNICECSISCRGVLKEDGIGLVWLTAVSVIGQSDVKDGAIRSAYSTTVGLAALLAAVALFADC